MTAPRGQVLTQPVELRDILPTFMDAAGVSIDPSEFDGRSLLELVRGRTEGWRPWIDLEHSQAYGNAGYWNALTDGRMKYIHYASDGRDLLFDLQKDPCELHDLAADPQHAEALRTWRQRLTQHLAERGGPFVRDGQLVERRPNMLYSPNFPKDTGEPATKPHR